jgi:F420-dependent oxidoreductase-like protein
MKLGLHLGYSGATLDIPVELVQRAEALGYDSVWTAEAYGSDAVTPLAFLAGKTSRIKLGTAIMQLSARTPANAAMSAATVDALAGGGRFIAGIGVSGPQIVEGWYGQPWGKPYWRIRDYVEIMRKIFRREAPVAHEGREISLPYAGPGAMGLGKPLKSILHMRPDIPIYLGTGNEATVKLTGEIADGWLPLGFVPGSMPEYRPWLEEGFRRAGRAKGFGNFEIQASVHVEINNDVKAALARLKPEVALYVGGMGHRDKNYHKDIMIRRGFGEAAARIQELYLAHRKEEATAAVPDEWVDLKSLVGPPARIKQRYRAWEESGATGLTVRSKDKDVQAIEVMAEAARLNRG